MGSLRLSRSDAEIRHGSFSHRLVVGRPKSHKAGRNVEVIWHVELVSSHTIADCRMAGAADMVDKIPRGLVGRPRMQCNISCRREPRLD